MHYVLTYNPEDNRLKEILDFIRRHNLRVTLSKVSGFGMPELRIGPGEYVEGVKKITQFLKEQQLEKQGK